MYPQCNPAVLAPFKSGFYIDGLCVSDAKK